MIERLELGLSIITVYSGMKRKLLKYLHIIKLGT